MYDSGSIAAPGCRTRAETWNVSTRALKKRKRIVGIIFEVVVGAEFLRTASGNILIECTVNWSLRTFFGGVAVKVPVPSGATYWL